MVKQNVSILNFNRGIISPLGLARQDVDRISLSAVTQNNFMPRVLGSMMLRPGLEYTGDTYNHEKAFHIPFVYAINDTAIIEITNGKMRVKVSDTPVVRPSVSTTVTNGDFTFDISGWTDDSDAGCTAQYASGGYLSLTGTGVGFASVSQYVSVPTLSLNIENAFRLVVTRGKVSFKIGTTSGADDIYAETEFGEGEYSIAFTPTSGVYISISSRTKYASLVDSCTIESSGDLLFDVDWGTSNLSYIRYDQSGDVVYVSCKDVHMYKIIRYTGDSRSWGVAKFIPEDGPFRVINTTSTTLTPSALSGNITLTASSGIFRSTSVGSIYRLSSIGQQVEDSIAYPVGADTYTDPIRITGVGAVRYFTVTRSGTWVGTVKIQRSLGDVGSWVDAGSYTTNGSFTYNDALDNQIAYYRIGVDSGGLSSGTVTVSLEYDAGSIYGTCLVTGYTSDTQVSAITLSSMGSISGTTNWSEGYFSARRGYPSANAIHEGRLCLGGQSRVFASVSDAYESFDDMVEGDSAAFTKLIPSGPSDDIGWLLSMKRLLVGTASTEWYLRSSTQDEVLTPSNANMKATSTFGSSNVQAVQVDNVGIFVQRSGQRILKSGYTIESDDYRSEDLSKLAPEIFISGVIRQAVQRTPDTRIHYVLGDGTVAVFIQDELENVKSFVTISTDGVIEDVFTIPAEGEDYVYYCVKRTINGVDKRYLEKFSFENECIGGTLNKNIDSFIVYQGSATSTITGLDHLEGEEVVVWADGKDYSPLVYDDSGVASQTTYTVLSGAITLADSVSNAVIGLPYTAQYKSVKLGMNSLLGTSLNQIKKVNSVGVIMANTHNRGLRYGPDFDSLDELPLIEDFDEVGVDHVYNEYDSEPFEFDGEWDTDSRVCLEAMSPRPCNLLACIIQVTMHEKNDRQ